VAKVAAALMLATSLLVVLAMWMPEPVADATFQVLRVLDTHSEAPAPGDQAVVVLGGRPSRGPKAAELSIAAGLPLYVACCGLEPVVSGSGVTPVWTERLSTDTQTNASVAACTLLPLGVRRIALVTDEEHIMRSSLWFRLYGFSVTKIPTALLPAERSREETIWSARHEVAGLIEVAWEWVTKPLHQELRCAGD
jgi:hypothetical protein